MTDTLRTSTTTTTRVLIVDDAPDIRLLLRYVLRSAEDFEVVGQAGDGREAIDQARALHPDIVLLDLSMPGTDGLEALPHLLAIPGTRVIVLSGYARETMGEQAIAAGAIGYIEKGAPPGELLAELRAVVAT